MNSLKLVSSKNIQYLHAEHPGVPPRHWITVKVHAAGLCGSDIQKMRSSILPSSYLGTDILGHEFAGDVIELGQGVHTLKTGDRVTVVPLIPCRTCSYCKNAQYQQCTSLQSMGKSLQGGFAEYVHVPAINCRILTTDLSYIDGALTDIVAVGLHAFHLANSPHRKNILIIGDGPVALLLIQICTYYNNEVSIVGKNKTNIQVAQRCGAKTYTHRESLPENTYDIVFESVGRQQSETINKAITYVKRGGTVVVLGVFEIGYTGSFIFRDLFYKEVGLIGSNSYSTYRGKDEFDMALKLIKNKVVTPSDIVTHTLPLSDGGHVLELIENKESNGVIKIVFDPRL